MADFSQQDYFRLVVIKNCTEFTKNDGIIRRTIRGQVSHIQLSTVCKSSNFFQSEAFVKTIFKRKSHLGNVFFWILRSFVK